MDRVMEPLKRVGQSFSQFTTAQKLIAVIGIAAIALGGTAFWRWASEPTMTPLFSNLAMTDASAITDQLDASGVSYTLVDGGQSILVPQEQVYALRLDMSAAGLPGSTDTGYALLDEQGVTASQFQQQTTWQRALEGELATTIGSISSVESARVQLAIPEDDVFADTAGTPTASVLVQTRPGEVVGDDQVTSVVNLVSASVEGMAPQDVTVVDGEGTLLSAGLDGGGAQRDSQTADYEERVTAALQQVLDQVVGRGNAVATVTADLDLDAVSSTQEVFTEGEDGAPALSESTTEETYTGPGGSAVGGQLGGTGILGPDNIAVPTGEDAGTAGEYRNATGDVQRGVDKETTQTQRAPGGVRRQSVSVVVDTVASRAIDMQALTDTVNAAAGVDAARGDVVSVSQMPFDTSAADSATAAAEAAAAAAAAEQRTTLITTGAVLLVVLVLVAVALLAARRRRKGEELEGPFDLGPLEVLAPEPLPAPETVALPAAAAPAELEARPALVPLPPTDAARAREEVSDLVDRQPDEVAELLRGWLAADKR